MKKYIIIFLAMLTLSIGALHAQERKRPHLSKQEFKEQLKTYLTKEANLTDEEVVRFFPIYDECQQKKHKLNDQIWKYRKQIRGKELTEEEYAQLLENEANIRIEIEKLEKSYIEKYHKVLPYKKVFEIKRGETRFQRELLRGLKKK